MHALTQVQSAGILTHRAEARMPEFDPPETYDLLRNYLPPHDDTRTPGVAYAASALVECRSSALRTYCSPQYIMDTAREEIHASAAVRQHFAARRELEDSGASIELDAHGYEISRRVHVPMTPASAPAPYPMPEEVSMRDGMAVLQQYGCPQMETYDSVSASHALTVRSDASEFRIGEFASISTAICARRALVLYGPLAIIFPIYHYGSEPWIPSGRPMLGYHAMTIVGYNLDGFMLRNSWGTSWGSGGYTLLPWADWGLQTECWTQVTAATPPASAAPSRNSSGSSGIFRKFARQLSGSRNGSPRSAASSPRSGGSPRTAPNSPRGAANSPRAASDSAIKRTSRDLGAEVQILYSSSGAIGRGI